MPETQLLQTKVPFIMMGIYILVVFFLSYKATIAGRLLRRHKDQTFEEFYTGNKSMSAVVVGLVTIVTFYSGTTFTGRVGFVYNFGVIGLTSIFICSFTGVIMFFLSEKVWPLAKKYRLGTLSDILELRYQSKHLKTLTAAVIVSFNIIWLITEIRTLGYAVNVASGDHVSATAGSAVIFAIIIAYVCTGGIRSVASVDSFSSAFMLAGSVVVLIYIVGYYYQGSLTDMLSAGVAADPAKSWITPQDRFGMPYWISSILLGVLVMLVYPSNFMSICMAESVRSVKKSALATSLSGVWLMIYGLFAFAALGLAAQGIHVREPEASLLEMLSYTGNEFMLGLVLTFVLAAALGTLDSTLISLSALTANDIITNCRNIMVGEPCIGASGDDAAVIEARTTKRAKSEVLTTRAMVVFLGVVAFILSLKDLPLLVLLTNYATNGLVQIVPTAILGLYWRKSTPQAAMISIPTGLLVFLALDSYMRFVFRPSAPEGVEFLDGFFLGTPALIVNLAVFIIVSLATCKKYYAAEGRPKGVYDDFFVPGRVAEYLKRNKMAA